MLSLKRTAEWPRKPLPGPPDVAVTFVQLWAWCFKRRKVTPAAGTLLKETPLPEATERHMERKDAETSECQLQFKMTRIHKRHCEGGNSVASDMADHGLYIC